MNLKRLTWASAIAPVVAPDFNNWGFWFFGIWVPL